jgi:hypothetical protein
MHKLLPLNWVQWLSLLTVAALSILMPFLIIRVENAHRDTNNSIRSVLCYFEHRALESPQLTEAQKRQAVRIYAQALAQIGEPACRS